MKNLDESLAKAMPLDRQKIANIIRAGCGKEILDFLLRHFCVSDETDIDDDLGFKFSLRLIDDAEDEFVNGKYVLYVSCVAPYATVRFYRRVSKNSYRSDSVAVSAEDVDVSGHLKRLCAFLSGRGYEVLTDKELSKEVGEDLIELSGMEGAEYFNLLFSEYQ